MNAVGNKEVEALVDRVDRMVEDETVQISHVIAKAGRHAIGRIVRTMEEGSTETLKFKAAQDLADRSPETSKTQKIAATHFTLDGEDAKELAASLVEAAALKSRYAETVQKDFVKTDTDKVEALPSHVKRIAGSDG